ncbi:MAG: AAA family ATPase, partial [Candidatus Hermodarchaeia archaeon]
MTYPFYKKLAQIINARQSRSVILCGNVYDLFRHDGEYMPLIDFLSKKTQHPNILQVVYELNGPIRVEDEKMLKEAYILAKAGKSPDDLAIENSLRREPPPIDLYQTLGEEFDRLLRESQGNTTLALQFLRQLTIISRQCLRNVKGEKVNLLIIIESADMLLPMKDIASLNEVDRRRIAIMQDWFSDPQFCAGGDVVCMVAESRSLIHSRVSRLPQVLSIEVPSPNTSERQAFIDWFGYRVDPSVATPDLLVEKVEEYIKSQVGDDVVEFKKPGHSLKDVIGFSKLKEFLHEELIPRFRTTGEHALPGAAVAGPIGSGKTFIFEAVAAELGVPVLVLKNIRSQWFGQTDVIFERLRRVLEALEKVIIFVDEADTQFGGVGAETHATERRLTGKIQAMMSDPKLRGKVTWLLMTARINLLSPDIRRPGRVGDLIIPILDPSGKDHADFVEWVLSSVCDNYGGSEISKMVKLTEGYSAAGFASLRSNLQAKKSLSDNFTFATIEGVVDDHIPPAIGKTREYQKFQALLNCTRKSLLPRQLISGNIINTKEEWERRIR